jgi:hypothetical protein
MGAGNELRRSDAPLPELEAYVRVIACAVALVRTADAGVVDGRALARLTVAVDELYQGWPT